MGARKTAGVQLKFHITQSLIKIINLDITARWIEQQKHQQYTYAGSIFIHLKNNYYAVQPSSLYDCLVGLVYAVLRFFLIIAHNYNIT